jgi:surfactin synthase thioesterase subunit
VDTALPRKAPVQLICVPHAGGTAALYRRWARALPPGLNPLAAELPGHGARRDEAAHTAWPALIADLAAEWAARLDFSVPYAVFGHSMGALVGLELIHALRARSGVEPAWFGVSASVAPSRRIRETHWLECSREAMIAKLRSLGGTPEVLLADHDLVDYLLPVLRADFHLCGTYPDAPSTAARRRTPLACPIDVFIGQADPATADAAAVAAWREETRAHCEVRRFEGGHFYLEACSAPVLSSVAGALTHALAAAAPVLQEARV